MGRKPWQAILDIRRGEWRLAGSMFLYFFVVITTFWILKPIKKALFIRHYQQSGFDLWGWVMTASQAELLAKVLNMVVAFGAVTAFTLLSRRLSRQRLTYVFSGFFMATFVAFTFVLDRSSDGTVWTFYLFGDLYNTLMVATFFAFLNDSVSAGDAKRLYGVIVLGGVGGGFFGSMGVRVWIGSLRPSGWLWICLGLAVVVIACAAVAGREVERRRPPRQVPPPEPSDAVRRRNPAVAGASLVFRSRYLLAVVAIVGLYELVSTILDFQFTSTVQHYLRGAEVEKQFSTTFLITNCVSMFVQLFLTSYVMKRFGMKVALLVLPFAILVTSAGYLALPLLWMGSMLSTANNAFNYSINQSAKEALYVPTTRAEKYQAKAFIDMFVNRFAKALAVGVSLAITALFAGDEPGKVEFSGIRWLSLPTIAVVALWLLAVRYAGNRFAQLTEKKEDEPAETSPPR